MALSTVTDGSRTGGVLPRDEKSNPVQVASSIVTKDGTGTPIDSPKSLTTTAVFTFVPPSKAVMMVCRSAAAFRYGDNATLDGTANEGYMAASADTDTRIPCAGGGSIYVRNESTGTNNFFFYFELLG